MTAALTTAGSQNSSAAHPRFAFYHTLEINQRSLYQADQRALPSGNENRPARGTPGIAALALSSAKVGRELAEGFVDKDAEVIDI